MNPSLIISIVLCGAPPGEVPLHLSSPGTDTRQAQLDDAAQAPAPDQLREAYLTVVRRSSKQAKPDPAEVVPQLVDVYVALDDADGIARRDIVRMRRVVKSRLEKFHARLLHDRLHQQQAQLARGQSSRVATAPRRQAEPAGPAERATAQELIELIQSVIEPEHWNSSGGPGRISYYQPGHALVITARRGVHEQIGGTLHELRRAGQ